MTVRSSGVKKIKIVGDSKLVISQVEGSFAIKEQSLAPYKAPTRQLLKTFEEVEMSHMPRSNNQYTDALTTLGSNLVFYEEDTSVAIVKRNVPMTKIFLESKDSKMDAKD